MSSKVLSEAVAVKLDKDTLHRFKAAAAAKRMSMAALLRDQVYLAINKHESPDLAPARKTPWAAI